MLPDRRGRYTAEDQRFFYPESSSGGEVIAASEVFDMKRPRVEVLGSSALKPVYLIYERSDGHIDSMMPAAVGSRNTMHGGERFITLKRLDNTGRDWDLAHVTPSAEPVQRLYGANQGGFMLMQLEFNVYTDDRASDEEFFEKYRWFVHPIDQPLPVQPGTKPGSGAFAMHGIIRPDGSLLTWDGGHDGAPHLVDEAVALKLANSALELSLLDNRLGQLSLVGQLSGRGETQTYLEWFRDKFGVNYIPDKDPRERYREFESPTEEQSRRLSGLLKLVGNKIEL